MKWHEGSVVSAVNEVRATNSMLLVFVGGDDDEQSRQMLAALESNGVQQKFNSVRIVALKLTAGSESGVQFSQIYPVVVIPSTYFIGQNGIPLEVIAGSLSSQDLEKKVESAIKMYSGSSSNAESAVPINSSSSPPVPNNLPLTPDNNVPIPSAPLISEEDTLPSTSQSSSPEGEQQSEQPTLQDKVERAKHLIEMKREKKEQEEFENEKLGEIERRKVGQEMQKTKIKNQEKEAAQVAADIAKERAQDMAARERVREQIAQDRFERNKKFQAEKEEIQKRKQEALQAEQERLAAAAAARSDVARLQFRLPDGSSYTNEFTPETTLLEVVQYVTVVIKPKFGKFKLCVTFPRRQLESGEHGMSLRQLGLVPSAALMVIPVTSSSGSVSQNSSSFPAMIFTALLSPFMILFRFFQHILFGAGGETRPPNDQQRNNDPSQYANERQQQGQRQGQDVRQRRAGEGGGATFRREGNIHRMDNNQDNTDDENNTWNGNSTQQQ